MAHVDTDKPAYSGTYFMWQYSWEAVSAESTAMLIWITAMLTLMRIQGSSAEWEEVSSDNGYKSIGGPVTLPSRRFYYRIINRLIRIFFRLHLFRFNRQSNILLPISVLFPLYDKEHQRQQESEKFRHNIRHPYTVNIENKGSIRMLETWNIAFS